MRLLWVEDKLADNQSIYDRLARRGASIRLASDVEQALSLLEAEEFDVVVADLNIPLGAGGAEGRKDTDYNGEYVIRAACAVGHLRVFCLTNFWEVAGTRMKSLDATVLRKSIYLDELERQIYGDH